jgi:hypothetical protein
MRDDHGRQYSDSESTQRAKAFEAGLNVLENMHGRRLDFATRREYFLEFEHCSPDLTKEALRIAIHDEKFFPMPATLKKCIAKAREAIPQEWQPARPVVQPYPQPKHTEEERADIARMKEDLRRKGLAMPWAQ